jgi:hypothetical protein
VRSTTERIKLAKKQADEIKKQRNEKRHRLAVISCYSFGIALIVVISALVCNLNFAGFEQTPMHDTASIFTNKGFLGYVVVGVLACYPRHTSPYRKFDCHSVSVPTSQTAQQKMSFHR